MWLCSGYGKANRIIEGFTGCFLHLLFVLVHFSSSRNRRRTTYQELRGTRRNNGSSIPQAAFPCLIELIRSPNMAC